MDAVTLESFDHEVERALEAGDVDRLQMLLEAAEREMDRTEEADRG